ncbi:XRE family transcriptional regulator [Occultella aeris]|uniref:Helix-turn-helix protein n=1 Tax=Occultella aeris TaxID=2761496 RepID=A0A7M4DE63_9MICO|nr:XRE family transcriptional regulator [Occultella aeris]VZO35177.1 helix-turn-helix protein [Occultella aeris]
MARNWKDVRRDAVEAGRLDEQRIEDAREDMLGTLRAHRLAEIRKSHQISQRALAASMSVSQARVSTIERGKLTRTELGTLQSYVEALGGRLKVVAEFGDESLIVRD